MEEERQLKRMDCGTESGAALELWSGFHTKDKGYVKRFVDSMGTCPKYWPDPNLGRSNLFIGLMIRFDVLARLGKIDTLVRELNDVYLPEIKEGSGTLFENYSAFSGCHGFNGAAGSAKCDDGPMFMNWSANQDDHILDINLMITEGRMPGWTILVNGLQI